MEFANYSLIDKYCLLHIKANILFSMRIVEVKQPLVLKESLPYLFQITKPPPRKRCVVLLYNRLSYLLKELEPWESKLTQATKRARIKLRKEVEDFVEKEEEV